MALRRVTISVRWIRGKKKKNTVQFSAQTDRFVSLDFNVSSQATGFNLVCVCFVCFFSLKDVSTIECHYMTDRLQRFKGITNLHLCSTEETKSPTSWMPFR